MMYTYIIIHTHYVYRHTHTHTYYIYNIHTYLFNGICKNHWLTDADFETLVFIF